MTGLPTRARVASALAVAAVVAVAGAVALTVTAYVGRDGDVAAARGVGPEGSPQPQDSPAGFPGWRVVVDRRAHARFEVPPATRGWTRPRDTVLYYVDRQGERSVAVTDPAVFRAGYCSGQAASNRGFAGFSRPGAGPAEGRSIRAANRALARRWVQALALAPDLTTLRPHTRLWTVVRTLVDGTSVVRSTARVAVDGPGPCGAPEAALTLLSLPTGTGVAHLVLVRDVGARGTLPARLAERIVETLRPLPG